MMSSVFTCIDTCTDETDSFIHSFIQVISIAPLQVLYYSEALPCVALCVSNLSTTLFAYQSQILTLVSLVVVIS